MLEGLGLEQACAAVATYSHQRDSSSSDAQCNEKVVVDLRSIARQLQGAAAQGCDGQGPKRGHDCGYRDHEDHERVKQHFSRES